MKVRVFLSVGVLVSAFSILTSAGAPKVQRIPASGSKLKISCDVPKNFNGQSATIFGELALSDLSNGAAKASGKLKVTILSGQAKSETFNKMVVGQYDDLTTAGSEKYFHGGMTIGEDEVLDIYINYTRPEMSYVEYSGKQYKTTCK